MIIALGVLGFFASALFLGVHTGTHWEWSVMMDDYNYMVAYPQYKDLSEFFMPVARDYWHAGRFYPVKYVMNFLEWRYLPLNAPLFHWIHFGILSFALALMSYRVSKIFSDIEPKWAPAAFVFGFGFLHRPLLDIVALCSIAETWVVLFLALGIFWYIRRPVLSRIAFIICGFSKEPAITIFMASALVGFVQWWSAGRKNKNQLLVALMDVVAFLGMVIPVKLAMSKGQYLDSYKLFSFQNAAYLTIGAAKSLFGLLPVFAMYVYGKKQPVQLHDTRLVDKYVLILLCVLFGGMYLFLVAPRGVAGYLLIPPTFAFFVAGAILALEAVRRFIYTQKSARIISILFLFCLAVSVLRYQRFAKGVSIGSFALKNLIETRAPRLIFVNGQEVSGTIRDMAARKSLPVTSVQTTTAEVAAELAGEFRGDVVLFELSSYFGRFPDSFIDEVGSAVGGWKVKRDRGAFRYFYGYRDVQ